MASSAVSIFEEASAAFKADSCDPLKRAHRAGELRLQGVGRGAYPGARLTKGVLPGLCSAGVWDADRDQTWGLDWHRNEGIEIAILDRGHCPFLLGGERHDLSAGQVTITRPWQPHRLGDPHIPASRLGWIIVDVGVRRPNQDWRWPDWICVAPKDLQRLTRLLRGNEHPVLGASRALRAAFARLMALMDAGNPPCFHSQLAVRINEVLVLLLGHLDQSTLPLDGDLSSSTRTVRLFLDELKTHPGQQARPWTVELMAERCGLKPHRFTELVREQVNLSPSRYLNECRLDTARRMLVETERSATGIAAACGFATSQYFSLVFKKATGQTPVGWRSGRKG